MFSLNSPRFPERNRFDEFASHILFFPIQLSISTFAALSATASNYNQQLRSQSSARNNFFSTSLPALTLRAASHAPCRNRTYNLVIKSHLLCQLS